MSGISIFHDYPYNVSFNFSDWFRQLSFRTRGWKYGFSHFPTAVSTVKLSFVTWGRLFSFFIESDSPSKTISLCFQNGVRLLLTTKFTLFMFQDYFIYLIICLQEFAEPSRSFTLKTYSDVRRLISTPINHELLDHVLFVQSLDPTFLSLFSVT